MLHASHLPVPIAQLAQKHQPEYHTCCDIIAYGLVAGSPRAKGGKRAWTKNKLEELRRRSPGHDSPASDAKPGANANMGNETQKRRLITFIGGLDMCDGRYDTPRHSLFHTLATVHTEDFHQACITGADLKKGGDLLCCQCYALCAFHSSLWGCALLQLTQQGSKPAPVP